ncbi:proline dehydrogenase family protein [Cytophagaceae bacterium DM2B3-1]|uniref:Proline dehydrogenase family protein n=1 Tax=Xanthocytophaga flava TaxID=3048013 RepID=A0ABT7CG81_9BACT|nr:proline dehydrogenase family protein [Xanthocytophaga flavus]MDJ1492746.1 proline dehydrogenase family protein [Xanthocytophaga flavus]
MIDPKPVASTPQRISFDDTEIAFSSKSNSELRKMYGLFASMNSNFLVKTGTAFLKAAFAIKFPFVRQIVKNTIFEHFCGGETIEECEKTTRELWKFRVGTILDYSVEGAKTDAGFEATTQEIIRTIEKAAGNPAIPFSVFKITGLASTELLQKVQNGNALNSEEQKDFVHVKERVERICHKAYEKKVRIFIDAEETWIQDTIDRLAYEMMEMFNHEEPIVYNTFQMYRWDMLDNLKKAHEAAVEGGYFLGVKLVRGAYMEKEGRVAKAEGRQDPIQPNKPSTDRDFNDALRFCIANYPKIAICAGTHNEESTYFLIELMKEAGIAPADSHIFFAQLYGMSDNLSYNLSHAGYNVAKYVPYGPVAAVMPYLFRRASENTAIAGQSSREFRLIKKEMRRRKL